MGPQLDPKVSAIVAAGDEQALSDYLAHAMEAQGHRTSTSRTPSEIAARLRAKVAMARTQLCPRQLKILRSFLQLQAPMSDASATLIAFAEGAGLSLSGALQTFEMRANALKTAGVDLCQLRYHAAFGRPFDYYTGLVFELIERETSTSIGGGGRFDRLLRVLGSRYDIPSVGFSIQLNPLRNHPQGQARQDSG